MTSASHQADRLTLRAALATRLPRGWRTRFAPAPTGHLHLGHAVNAVYVWSIARAFGGQVVVRIEDHDRQRSQRDYERSIREDLAWLGLSADNDVAGLPAALRQSDTPTVYEAVLATLADQAHVYACRCSRRDIAAHTAGGSAERYPGTCRHAGVDGAAHAARRLELPDIEVTFADLRHGTVQQRPAQQCGDLLLRDRLAQWTYQFAVVVDDLRQGVDVIIRGDDLLESTGRQLLLAERLGRPNPPLLLHHPLVTHPDGAKLSKSRGDTGLAELRAAGWSPAQVLGQAAWLGGLQPAPEPITAETLATLWLPTERQHR